MQAYVKPHNYKWNNTSTQSNRNICIAVHVTKLCKKPVHTSSHTGVMVCVSSSTIFHTDRVIGLHAKLTWQRIPVMNREEHVDALHAFGRIWRKYSTDWMNGNALCSRYLILSPAPVPPQNLSGEDAAHLVHGGQDPACSGHVSGGAETKPHSSTALER